ncbi:MAG: Trm112 family protein [Candidatus Nanopelagicales bacterium]
MSLDPLLLDVLACPCPRHAEVAQVDKGLRCTVCEAVFPIRDGIPVMLLDQATAGPSGVVGVTDPS